MLQQQIQFNDSYLNTVAQGSHEMKIVFLDGTEIDAQLEIVEYYTVKWLDEDGTMLQESLVAKGEIPTCDVTPAKNGTDTTVFSFASWETAQVLYFTPDQRWTSAETYYAAYFGGENGMWVKMTESSTWGTYRCVAPEGYSYVVFCAMESEDLSWDSVTHQTSELVFAKGYNHYAVTLVFILSHRHTLLFYEHQDMLHRALRWS